MRILIVTHYFPPEVGAPQARLSELAKAWAAEGDDVTVLTGMPNHPTGIVPPEYRGRIRMEERVEGYRVLRTWLFPTPNEGTVKRALGHLSFMLTSVLLGWRRSGSADVVLVSSPTLFSIPAAWVLAKLKRARFVVEVRDLWPAILVELGVLKNKRLTRLMELLEWAAYREADSIVVVSDGFRKELIRRGVRAEKITTIRNGVDVDRFHPDIPRSRDVRHRLGATDSDVLVLYIGVHGLSQGLKTVADAAARLDGTDIHFAFVGEGADKNALSDHVRNLGTSNIKLLPAVRHEEVPAILAAADICLVVLRDLPLFKTFIPSKLFEYFGVGRPVVGAVAGETASILEEIDAVIVPPGNGEALASEVQVLAGNQDRRDCIGRQARRYAVEHCDRRLLAGEYRQLLAKALAD